MVVHLLFLVKGQRVKGNFIVPTGKLICSQNINKTLIDIPKQWDIKYRAAQQEIIQHQERVEEATCKRAKRKTTIIYCLTRPIAAGTKETFNLFLFATGTPQASARGQEHKLCITGVIWALQKRSRFPKLLPVIEVDKLNLTAPWNLVCHFNKISQSVFVGQSKMSMPCNNTEH